MNMSMNWGIDLYVILDIQQLARDLAHSRCPIRSCFYFSLSSFSLSFTIDRTELSNIGGPSLSRPIGRVATYVNRNCQGCCKSGKCCLKSTHTYGFTVGSKSPSHESLHLGQIHRYVSILHRAEHTLFSLQIQSNLVSNSVSGPHVLGLVNHS